MTRLVYNVTTSQIFATREAAERFFQQLEEISDNVTMTVIEIHPSPEVEKNWRLIESKEVTSHV